MKVNKRGTVASVCQETCRRVLAHIAGVREALVSEWSDSLKKQGKLLHLAMNEAEALAWETTYPHLVFPLLATEKVQAVAAWKVRQQRIGAIT